MDIAAFDPGLHGAAALLRSDFNRHNQLENTFLDMVDIPTLEDGESRRQVDVLWLGSLLERWNPDIAVIENVQVPHIPERNPGADRGFRQSAMSPSDAFRFGLACGMIRATIIAYQLDYELVHPRTWTSFHGLKGGDKKPHVAHIKKISESARQFITLAKHDGRADAGLMALWYAEKGNRGFLEEPRML